MCVCVCGHVNVGAGAGAGVDVVACVQQGVGTEGVGVSVREDWA